ncbi:ABC transporter permease subunit [Actinosynnema sp. NPDC047251]|uniref:ABC-type transporter n=1 Tax=Saccharothrix espanaensis (strain ATCC 51144 / DSM 44229 / JCM 9112 / NBRC 15066 / NRRL 15764) TaxID=1179773 RepID=K0K2W1_SACES|nr:ABC transporter permease subunit [Saccharothrix espanaensis]CCH32616.1 ABC-type transporter [Saccharothrix espanaensis DSM 44229]
MTTTVEPDAAPARPGWWVIAGQESRDLWFGGRGPVLLFAYSVLLSAVTYLAATNQILNFLEQREAVNLTLQVSVAVGVLITMVVAADAISGERERGTFESLLLSPVSRGAIVQGKLAAAMSLWGGTFLVSLPYLWVLGHGVGVVAGAVLLGMLVGTLLAFAMAAIGLLISAVSSANKVSLGASLFLVLALFAPTQLPAMPTSAVGEVLTRVNPLTAGMHYLQLVVLKGHSWTQDLGYLISPVVAVAGAVVALAVAGPRIVRLGGGGGPA